MLLAAAAGAHAQVLARPGWAGAGVVPSVWWRNAVFYRIDPARFQDSTGSGTGDLAGLVQRLPYLRTLGVDALVLDGPVEDGALGDLLRAAAQTQLRVVMAVSPELQQGDRRGLLGAVHAWLGLGVAGLYLTPLTGAQAGGGAPQSAAVAASLQAMMRSLPGDRVLLGVGDLPGAAGAAGHERRGGTGLFRAGQDGVLPLGAEVPTGTGADAAALRESLTALASAGEGQGVFWSQFAQSPATGTPNAFVFAAALLASRGDALFAFGDEIGLDTGSAVSGAAGHALPPVMQWTPANVQQPAAAPVERRESTPGVTSFGPYRPYVRPPSTAVTGAAPGLPGASVDATLPAELPAPDTLLGFTTGRLPAPPVDGTRINVATEDRDPGSLLNAYRQLIALHHSNSALASGAQMVLNRDAQRAVVWVRRAAAGQGGGDVVVAANLGDQAVTLALDEDLMRLRVRTGSLRPLFMASPTPLTAESTGALMLPPHAVLMGEVRRHP